MHRPGIPAPFGWRDGRQLRPSQHAAQGILAYTGRSQGYHELFWDKFKDDLANDGVVVETIEFAIMAAAVASIPTAYSISECNADLLELAARDVVSSTLDPATVERLAEMGFIARKSDVVN